MRIWLITSVLMLLADVTEAAPAPPWAHTRPSGSGATELLADAERRSSIIVAQLRALERTDVVVYVMDSVAGAVKGPRSHLAFLCRAAGTRYFVIQIARSGLSPTDRIAMLGHELQHALEVAAAPEVKDAAGLADLYRRIGWESGVDHFESEEARITTRRIRRELSGPLVTSSLSKRAGSP